MRAAEQTVEQAARRGAASSVDAAMDDPSRGTELSPPMPMPPTPTAPPAAAGGGASGRVAAPPAPAATRRRPSPPTRAGGGRADTPAEPGRAPEKSGA